MWHQTAPLSPNGIALMMISGCTYDRSGAASSARNQQRQHEPPLQPPDRVALLGHHIFEL